MAVTQQRTGVGSLGYPFYLADFAADLADPTRLPTPTDSDATLVCLETRQTLVWRTNKWVVLDDQQALTLAAIRQAVEAPSRVQLMMLRELRGIRMMLAHGQGISSTTFEPIPELDGLGN